MEILTNEYEFSHGKKPRGFGSWLFKIGYLIFEHRGNYGDAKKAAIAKAREHVGSPIIKVLP